MSLLDDQIIRSSLLQAWAESKPGTFEAHEEGGFILRDTDGALRVERWPRGGQNEIFVPLHPGGKRGDATIVATFHTHPNVGPDFQQEPSLTDIRAVRDDAELSHAEFEGEYVISHEQVYRIETDGRVRTIGETKTVLKID